SSSERSSRPAASSPTAPTAVAPAPQTAAQRAAFAADPPAATRISAEWPRPRAATSSIRSPTARNATATSGARCHRTWCRAGRGGLRGAAVGVRVIEDLERVLAAGVDLEGVAGLPVVNDDAEASVALAPEQRNLHAPARTV